MVVYFKPEGNRFGQSSATGMIEQGAQVKEGQKMLRIPNLERMQVNAKVKLPDRSKKHAYDDKAPLAGRKFHLRILIR
jgi:hypothetical protein